MALPINANRKIGIVAPSLTVRFVRQSEEKISQTLTMNQLSVAQHFKSFRQPSARGDLAIIVVLLAPKGIPE
jgi:hypothetical protein